MSNNKQVQMNYAMCADSIYMQLKKQGLQFNKKDFNQLEKERNSLYRLRFADYFSYSLYDKMLSKLHNRVMKTLNKLIKNNK